MAITVEYLKGLGVAEETAKTIFAERGKEINAANARAQATLEAVQVDLTTANSTIAQITSELDGLKANNASAEEYKTKFEELQKQIADKEAQEKAEKAAAEKEANIKARYTAASVDKDGKPLEWAHDAIRDSYYNKFAAALEDKANEGKSDADIFHALTKDDATAFKGVQAFVLEGGKPIDTHGVSREDFAKMGYAERLKLKTEQPELYKAITDNKE